VGAAAEYDTNFWGVPGWPTGKGVKFPEGSRGMFTLTGNHEMLSQGDTYFNSVLPRCGVKNDDGSLAGMPTSFGAIETAHWRVIMIDDSYNSYPDGALSAALDSLDLKAECKMPDSHVAWLARVLGDPNDKRGIILMGHHNYRNAFANSCIDHAKQIAGVLPGEREIVWLYGHIHSFQMQNAPAKVDNDRNPLKAWSRCLGARRAPPPSRARHARC